MISKKRFLLKRKIDDIFGKFLFDILKSRKKRDFPEKIEKIVIFKLSTIGDSLLCLPAIKALKEKTNAEIVLVHSGDNKIIFENLDFIDKKIKLDVSKNNYLGILKTLYNLRKEKADVAVDLSHTGNLSAVFSKISGKYLIGFYNKEVSKRKGFYDFEFDIKDKHMHQNYFGIFSRVEKSVLNSDKKLIKIPEKKKVVLNLETKKELVGIHPCHEIEEKSWGKENFAKLIDYLIENKKTPVLLGSPTERKEVQKIISLVKNKKNLIDLSGKLNIEEVNSLMPEFEFFISNDGGIMHLASTHDIPVLGIFMAETPKKYAPFNKKSYAIDARKLESQESFELAKEAIDMFLEGGSQQV